MRKKQALRNPYAHHPIMRKGGVHEKSKSAKRAATKRDTRQKASEWLGRPFAYTLNRNNYWRLERTSPP